MTEGEKAINIKLSLSLLPSRLRRATFLVRGRLYFHIIVNLIAPESSSVFINYHGGSKPSPYHVVVCFVLFATAFGCLSLTMQLLLFRKNHAWLACSFVNALTTAHCRYQLLRFADRGKPCPYGLWAYAVISIKKESLFRLSFNVFVFNCLSIVHQLFDFFF